jgi:ubiquinone/menaquinone biosynthesis C-methylase UbiE
MGYRISHLSKPENFDGQRFGGKAEGFESPTQLPRDERQSWDWQETNRSWWERSPMRYDWQEGIEESPGEARYFDEIDRRFFASVWHYMPWLETPFDNLIYFEKLPEKDVLEIGVGYGSHAELIAPHCLSFEGIDLTEAATVMTNQRMRLRGINASIQQMDAENMSFNDQSFDWIWSWGVIHHSADTDKIIQEMARVLRPGGGATVMVYHRSPWKYYFMDGFIKGILFGEYFKLGSLHAVSQAQTDGAIARYYTKREFLDLASTRFDIKSFRVTGHKSDVIPLPVGRLKQWVSRVLPDLMTRFFTDRLRFGSFLIVELNLKIGEG